VLETGEYIPVGATEVKKTDVRIVAATNVNIQKAISEGRFREDLYYRLNTISIQMPALRDRGEDIVLLFRLFAMQMAEKYRMERVVLTDEAKQLLMKYKWPGNVRQLKNITEQISILSTERTISKEVLSKFIPQNEDSTQLATIKKNEDHSFESEREVLYKILFELRSNVNELRHEMGLLKKQFESNGKQTIASKEQQAIGIGNNSNLPAQQIYIQQQEKPMAEDAIAEEYVELDKEQESLNLDDLERQMLEKALERNGGNRKKAALELGISDRSLYRRIKQYGLDEK
jgi:transcriptional regulator with PAS, ATPase and Fis domain